ncbi:MAG TPA: hypothetical protein VKA79_15005 [Aestuariivirgaceae bacterium]|nr:hypothetical protein [Aestuariivirgaceae bacterium]
MALSAEYLAFIKDQMSGFGPVSIKRMFGGAGVSLDDVNFAIHSLSEDGHGERAGLRRRGFGAFHI